MTLLPQPRSIERPDAIATWLVSGAPGSGARSAFAVHRRGQTVEIHGDGTTHRLPITVTSALAAALAAAAAWTDEPVVTCAPDCPDDGVLTPTRPVSAASVDVSADQLPLGVTLP